MGRKATARFLRRLGAQRVSARRAAALALVVALAGCTVRTVQQRVYPRLQEGIEPIHRVALAPFSAAGDVADAERRAELDASVGSAPRTAGPGAGEGQALVARYLAEALANQGLDVTTHEDLGRALGEAGSSLEPREVARLAAERFGAQGVLIGNVARFRERRAGVGEDRAASVWFEVSLYKAPEGDRLWTGVFNETQRDLSSNVLVAARYPGGGMRWLSVDELARWGAGETARSMPLGATTGTATGP